MKMKTPGKYKSRAPDFVSAGVMGDKREIVAGSPAVQLQTQRWRRFRHVRPLKVYLDDD